MFEEIQIVTGGAEITNPAPGVQFSAALKSGTNIPHGALRGYLSTGGMQSTNLPDELAAVIDEGDAGTLQGGNRLDQFADYGFDLGGPIIRDKWWAWGLFGRTDIRNRTLIGTPDRILLKNYVFKTTGQFTDRVRGSFLFFGDTKVSDGRGASPTRPPETTHNQTGPSRLYKGEGNFILGDDVILSARGSYLDFGFSLAPAGGTDTPAWQDFATKMWHGSFVDVDTRRPQWTSIADGNWFTGRHEVKFGYSFRRAIQEQSVEWPGNSTISLDLGGVLPPGSPPILIGFFVHDSRQNFRGDYLGTYLSPDYA